VAEHSDEEMALFSQLDDVFAEVDSEGVQSIQDHSTPYLIRRVNDLKARLFAIGQAITEPTSQEARDLHSEYYACMLELRRRGL
jgi:hypothetical protein